jgi:hypothetical protein
MVVDLTLKLSDLAIVFATLLGPVLAVQAQKWVERQRERNRRRVGVFRVLMTTRAAILSPAHVEALNIVPIEFYGQKKSFTEVVDAWKEYIDWLYRDSSDDPKRWGEKRVELLNSMLAKMGAALGYRFNSVEISRELYSPKGHAAIESDQEIIRRGLAKMFRGELAIPMDVKTFPVDENFVANQLGLQKGLLDWLGGQRSVRVTMEGKRQ